MLTDGTKSGLHFIRILPQSMKLSTRVVLIYLSIAILVMMVIGLVLPLMMYRRNLASITENSMNQLKSMDFAVSNFIRSVKNDLLALSMNDDVRVRGDAGFTNFTFADGKTFQYRIGFDERKIITVFNAYRMTHPNTNSVYMGRENGSFVRSHKRDKPTKYDPRSRPWYIAAKESPGRVVLSEPYRSVTSADMNIAVVTALTDSSNRIFGVVGIDVTMKNLTDYFAGFDVGHGGKLMLCDKNGTILVDQYSGRLFGNMSGVLKSRTTEFLSRDKGIVPLEDKLLVYRTSHELGWKICIVIPSVSIRHEIIKSVWSVLIYVIIALVLLSAITIYLLNTNIIKPLTLLNDASRNISETGSFGKDIETDGAGELGMLAHSFNAMVERLRTEESSRKKILDELTENRDNLEMRVAERTRELEKAKEEAESADNLKSAFLATMSHELRTPLNSIIGFSGILLQELAGPLNDEQKKQLGMLSKSSEHLLELINDVLDISKIEANQLTLTNTDFSLRESIEKILGTVNPIAEKKGITLESTIPTGTGVITGDKRRVEQILLNLLSNSIKFTDTGTVRLECEEREDTYEIRVKDTGIGIKAEDMDKLFKPFRQVESGLTRQYEGTGLGLSICRKLLDMMGGSIMVESEWGKGSTFIVILPKKGGMS